MKRTAVYGAMTITLSPGDAVVLYSDGIYEAQGNAAEQYGFERMEALLSDLAGSDAQAMAERLTTVIDDYTGHTVPEDDRTVVTVRVGAGV